MRPLRDIFLSYAEVVDGRHVNGTDKQTNHAYGDAYDKILTPHTYDENLCTPVYEGGRMVTRSCKDCASDTSHFRICPNFKQPSTVSRESIKLMLEIGVADGSSLLAWREALPNATVVGMDIHPASRWDGEFHLGDQTSREDCERVAVGRKFDLIVEDATHQLADTLVTLSYMWRHVKPGGMYIVEEWSGASGDRDAIRELFPNAEIVGTCGPHIQDEPLVVFRKPL